MFEVWRWMFNYFKILHFNLKFIIQNLKSALSRKGLQRKARNAAKRNEDLQ